MPIIDNSANYITRMNQAKEAALEAVGTKCRSHAQRNINAGTPRHKPSWYTGHGALKNSMSYQVDKSENAVVVGTNLKYAIYNEYGTGKYADGQGRQGWWVFVPGSDRGDRVGSAKVYTEAEARRIVAILQSKGIDAHMTQGMPPLHFLKRAVEEHREEYRDIIQKQIARAMGGGF